MSETRPPVIKYDALTWYILGFLWGYDERFDDGTFLNLDGVFVRLRGFPSGLTVAADGDDSVGFVFNAENRVDGYRQKLTDRAVKGRFRRRLANLSDDGWVSSYIYTNVGDNALGGCTRARAYNVTGHLPASINEWFGVGWHSAKSQTAHFRQHKQPELVMRLTKGEIRPQPTDQKAR